MPESGGPGAGSPDSGAKTSRAPAGSDGRAAASGQGARPTRTLTQGARRYSASVAWRGEGGHGLLYFQAIGPAAESVGSGPAGDDLAAGGVPGGGGPTHDRRCALEPGEDLGGLSDAELLGRLDTAAPLSPTETRWLDPSGRAWLVQSTGPVWTESGAAAGLSRLLFTALDGLEERFDVPNGHVGRLDADAIETAWRAGCAVEPDGGGAEPP